MNWAVGVLRDHYKLVFRFERNHSAKFLAQNPRMSYISPYLVVGRITRAAERMRLEQLKSLYSPQYMIIGGSSTASEIAVVNFWNDTVLRSKISNWSDWLVPPIDWLK